MSTKVRTWGLRRRREQRGLQKALEAVQAEPRRAAAESEDSDLDSPEVRLARAYNSGLAMAARAIRREMEKR